MSALALLLAALAAGGAAEPPLQLDDVPAALATVLRDARADAKRRAGEPGEASARADAWGDLGMLYHAHRLRHLAQDAYRRALSEADVPRWRYLHAVVLSERGEIARGAADFQRVVQAQPHNMAAWYRLGVARFLAGDLEAAAAALARARRLQPDSALALAALADVASARGDAAAALKLLERAWTLEPQAGQLAYKLAMAHRAQGNVEQARRWLDRRPDNSLAPKIDDPLLLEVARKSRSARFYENAADWALARDDQEGALKALRSAVDLAPEDARLGLRLVPMLARAGVAEEAIQEVRRVLALDANSAPGWYLLAYLLRASPDPEDRKEAMSAAQRSLALADDAETRALAAALALRAGLFQDAAARYASLAQRQPSEGIFHYWLGLARLGAGDCGGRQSLAQALRLRKSWGEAHLVLSRADALCGDGEAAQRRAQALLKAKDDADTRLTLAFAAFALGQLDEARRLAQAELPHADAALVLDAVAARAAGNAEPPPMLPFARESEWWLPAELR